MQVEVDAIGRRMWGEGLLAHLWRQRHTRQLVRVVV